MAMPGDCPWTPGDQAYRCSENGQGEGARVGGLEPTNARAGIGRPPFWERPGRALPNPEEYPACHGITFPVGPDVNSGRTTGSSLRYGHLRRRPLDHLDMPTVTALEELNRW